MATCSTKSKEFFTVNSLVVNGDKIAFKDLANKYVGVFIADKIGLNFGVLLTTILCTLELPYGIPGVAPAGQIKYHSILTFYSLAGALIFPQNICNSMSLKKFSEGHKLTKSV